MMSAPPARPAAALAGPLCFAAMALALPLALVSLFPFGYWERAELLPIGLHATAALGALGLALGLAAGVPAARGALGHPLVAVLALLPAWSILALPFVDRPALSLAGTIQSGFGILWALDLVVLTACALALRDHARLWNALLWWAAAVTLVIAGFKLHDRLAPDQDHLLVYVAAYYGWIAVLATAIGTGGGRKLGLALAFAAVAVAAAADSATAALLLPAGAAYVVLSRLRPFARLAASRPVFLGIVAVAALLPYALLRWIPALGAASESLRDRQLLQRMMHAALGDQGGAAWLFGHGWGGTQDAFHTFLNVTGERLWQPTWIFLQSDYFHAHNWLLETLYAAGLPGLVLVMAGFLAIPLCAAPERRATATVLAAALAAIASVWFHLALSVPFVALALAAQCRPAARALPAPRAILAALVVVAGLQVGFAALQAGYVHEVAAFRAGHRTAFPADPRGSDLTASEVIRDDMLKLAAARAADPAAEPRALAMVDHLRGRIPDSTSSHFLVTAVNTLTLVYGSGDLFWLAPRIGDGKTLWRAALDRLLAVAPGRTDVAIPYLTHHAILGNLAEVSRVTERILARDPRDAVGLYFTGLLLTLDPAPERKRAGIDRLRASVSAGIERFMPLDPRLRPLIDGR